MKNFRPIDNWFFLLLSTTRWNMCIRIFDIHDNALLCFQSQKSIRTANSIIHNSNEALAATKNKCHLLRCGMCKNYWANGMHCCVVFNMTAFNVWIYAIRWLFVLYFYVFVMYSFVVRSAVAFFIRIIIIYHVNKVISWIN